MQTTIGKASIEITRLFADHLNSPEVHFRYIYYEIFHLQSEGWDIYINWAGEEPHDTDLVEWFTLDQVRDSSLKVGHIVNLFGNPYHIRIVSFDSTNGFTLGLDFANPYLELLVQTDQCGRISINQNVKQLIYRSEERSYEVKSWAGFEQCYLY